MVIRSAHHEIYNKLTDAVKRSMSPMDAEFVLYVMYQDMEFGGAKSTQDMRVQSLLRRYKNLLRDLGEENFLPIEKALEKAVQVSGHSPELIEAAEKKKLLYPLYTVACVCILEKFDAGVCRQCVSFLEEAVKTIKQPTLLDKLYNRDL